MIEQIKYKNKLYALIARKDFRKKKGISFFTPNNLNLQCGYMKHNKNYFIKPHLHKKRFSKIFYTSEVIYLLKGKLRIDFYTEKQNYLFSKIIKANEMITLIQGSHGFKTIEPVEMFEVKQGPFNMNHDKIKFEKVDEKKIKIK